MRRVGEQRLVRRHELLDPFRRAIEARRERGDFVTALHRDPRREIAASERLDARSEALEPARKTTHGRVSTHGNGERDHAKRGEEADRAGRGAFARQTRDQRPAVRQIERYESTAPPPPRASAGREWRTDRGERRTAGVEKGRVHPPACAQTLERGLLRFTRRRRRRQRTLRDLRRDVESGRWCGGNEVAPRRAGDKRERKQAGEHGQVDLEVEPLHRSASSPS